MSTTDAVLKMLSPLSPSGTLRQSRGKPAKRTKKSGTGDVARAIRVGGVRHKCGATQSQTRSMKLDVESPADIAAALGMVRDKYRQRLLQWVGLPWWQQDVGALVMPLLSRFPAHVTEKERYAIAASVLTEVRSSSSCERCGAAGNEWSQKHQQWVTCRRCHGTGWTVLSTSDRAKRVGVARERFRTALRDPYRDVWAWVTDELDHAFAEMRRRKGRKELRGP